MEIKSFKEMMNIDERVINANKKTQIDKKDILFKQELENGNTFVTINRDTSGMPGTQDKFSMYVIDSKGKVVKDMGSHPSLKGSESFMKNNMDELTEAEDINEALTFKGMEKKCNSLQNLLSKFDDALIDFQDIEDDRPASKEYTRKLNKSIDVFAKDLEALKTFLRKTN